jgi:hypothetical protein
MAKSLKLIPPLDGWLLDYGGGDGSFAEALANRDSCEDRVLVYEPHMKASGNNRVRVIAEWPEVEQFIKTKGNPSIITCFEVLEHFGQKKQEQTIKRFHNILAAQGQLIISVPIEGGAPALIKNGLRRLRYGGKHHNGIYSYSNIMKSLFWIPIPEFRADEDYLSHMGFYYPDLMLIIREFFTITSVLTSPISWLPSFVNSQVFVLATRE